MSTPDSLYPIYFQPVYKSYIWGGKNIAASFHRTDVPEKVAESWEVSDRQDGMSVVANGPLKGLTLHQLVNELGEALIGKGRHFSSFPLLIKLIDAHENLSIQVHPDDEKAKLLGSEAKTEMWYVLDTKEGAAVYSGLKPHIDRAAFERMIKEERVLDALEKIPVARGDVISIPGGRVHAILAGCLLLEVQQNSNTTYRIYDWDRVDSAGQPRPLHLKESLQVIDWHNRSHAKAAPQLLQNKEGLHTWELLKTPYFEMQKIETAKTWKAIPSEKTFQVFFLLEGKATLTCDGGKEEMQPGRTFLVPAACKHVAIEPHSPKAQFLRITL